MFTMDNIIPVWRVVVPNVVSESCSYLNLVMSIEFSSVEQNVYFVRGFHRSQASIKKRLFKEGLVGDSMVYFEGRERIE